MSSSLAGHTCILEPRRTLAFAVVLVLSFGAPVGTIGDGVNEAERGRYLSKGGTASYARADKRSAARYMHIHAHIVLAFGKVSKQTEIESKQIRDTSKLDVRNYDICVHLAGCFVPVCHFCSLTMCM